MAYDISTQSAYSLLDKAKSLINNEDLSDICFLVGESNVDQKKIYGHKLILSMGSPVFRQMFFGSLAEKEKMITIPDLSSTGFLNMIRYLYGEKMNFPIHELYETFMACHKYMINFCEAMGNYLEDNLNKENKVLVYDQLAKIKMVDDQVVDNINIDNIRPFIDISTFNNEYFSKISEDTLIDLLSSGFLEVDEFDILKSCMRWISESNSRIEDRRCGFKSIRSYINFHEITIDNLKELDDIDSFLTIDEIGSLFLFLANRKRPYPFELKTERRKPFTDDTFSKEKM